MLGNYLQQTTSVDDIFRCIFLGILRVKGKIRSLGSKFFALEEVPTLKRGVIDETHCAFQHTNGGVHIETIQKYQVCLF